MSSEPDWQEPPRRRSTREERKECIDKVLQGASVLLSEARAGGQESLTVGLEGIMAAALRLKGLVEGGAAPVEAKRAPTGPAPEPDVKTAPQGQRADSKTSRPGRAGGQTLVLVVDDNPLNREMLGRRLGQKGYAIEEACDGSEALAKIEEKPYDLILLDIMMPGLSGTEVLARIREKHSLSDLPVIMATAKDSAEDVLDSLKKGANDYVTKPLDFPIVLARVEVQLAYKRAKEEAQKLAKDLSASNRRLEEVQRRLVELQQGATGATQGLAAWTQTMVEGIAPLVGVREIGVYSIDEKGVHPLTATSSGLPAPAPSELEDARHGPKERGGKGSAQTVVAVLGPLGELHGGVVVPARVSLWADTERQLLDSFVRNLGTALDLQKVRGRLAEVEQRRAQSKQEMIARGIDVLTVCPLCKRCYSQAQTHCTLDGQVLKTPRLLPYRIAGRYRLVQLIGEGGMGTVFRAQDERLGRRVAMKILRSECFEDGEGHVRLQQEARAVANIDHPGVVKIFDSGDLEDGSAFLVMELVDGVNLKNVLERSGRGSCHQVATLIRQGAGALEAAHRAGVIHRDLKPENFICTPIDGSFQAKLLDFGVAKTIEVDTGVTRAGIVLGTPRYMSPEQVQDKPLDQRSDLYSFAVVAYECLAGMPVVAESGLPKVMMDVAVKTAPRITRYLPWMPERVASAFSKALEKDPEKRPKSLSEWAASFVDTLDAIPDETPGWDFSDPLYAGDHVRTVSYDVLKADPPAEKK
jgi:CheY-like chemotaxis protein